MANINRGFNPKDAISPRANWQLIDVLYEGEHWSMALGLWKSGNDKWCPVLAQRWNGDKGEKGNPTAHGFPTWFVLPEETYELFMKSKFIPKGRLSYVKEKLELP